MGNPKQLLKFEGASLLRRAVKTACDTVCQPVVVVLGADPLKCEAELSDFAVQVVHNIAWQEGISSSIRAAMQVIFEYNLEGVIIGLCDQPFLSVHTFNALIDLHLHQPKSIVVSQYGDTFGVPALFPKEFFSELLSLSGATGAKQIIGLHKNRCVEVPFPEGSFDIDTPQDYDLLSQKAV